MQAFWCLFQDYQGLNVKEWATHVCRQMEGQAGPPKGRLNKLSHIMQIMHFKVESKSLQHAIDLSKTFAALYTR